MMKWRGIWCAILGLSMALIIAVVACGGAEQAPRVEQASPPYFSDTAAPMAPAAAAATPTPAGLRALRMPAAPAPVAAVPAEAQDSSSKLDAWTASTVAGDIAVIPQQQRIIIRTVDMALVVRDVSETLDATGALAQELGGWVVQSSHKEEHHGFISIRVPAERLGEAIRRLRGVAVEVKAENSISQDVTDEYVDIQARVRNLKATEEQLIKLMDRAGKVEELLEVQRELTRVQGEIEQLQGRIKFLEETSAYSLINVNLELAPVMMRADVGLDQTVSEGEPARFRAIFTPPEDIAQFLYEWDFGDGSGPIVETRTAPGIDGTSRITATVTHTYYDRQDSPFIVTFHITGTGKAGITEGEDTLIVAVTRVPRIEVFAGDHLMAEEGETVKLNGSFTRPEGIADLAFRWDFGDGSEPVTGSLGGTETTAPATHIYPNHRPVPFTATLTVIGTGDTGVVVGTHTLNVTVTEATSWSPGGISMAAARALASVGRGLAQAGIWMGILSPIWGGGLLVGYLVWRRNRRSPP